MCAQIINNVLRADGKEAGPLHRFEAAVYMLSLVICRPLLKSQQQRTIAECFSEVCTYTPAAVGLVEGETMAKPSTYSKLIGLVLEY